MTILFNVQYSISNGYCFSLFVDGRWALRRRVRRPCGAPRCPWRRVDGVAPWRWCRSPLRNTASPLSRGQSSRLPVPQRQRRHFHLFRFGHVLNRCCFTCKKISDTIKGFGQIDVLIRSFMNLQESKVVNNPIFKNVSGRWRYVRLMKAGAI